MNPEPEDPIWQRLSKALFGGRKTSDEGLFTYRVMERIRTVRAHSGAPLQDLSWLRFRRWALPALGAAMAGFFLALRTPVPAAATPSTDTLLAPAQTPEDDLWLASLEE